MIKTYRDHGAVGPEADQPVWDDSIDHTRITQALHATDWSAEAKVTLAGFITTQSLQACALGFHDGPSADTASGVARALRDLEAQLTSRTY